MSEPTKSEAQHSHNSEAEYLRQQADDARAALVGSLHRAKMAAAGKVDPRKLTRSHPVIAVGSAVLAGFVAAMVTVPSKQQQELRRLAKIHNALHPEPAAAGNGHGSAGGSPRGSAAKPSTSLWTTIIHELAIILKPILMAAVTAQLESRSNKSTAPTSNPPVNGDGPTDVHGAIP
jgi:hypothetical protein